MRGPGRQGKRELEVGDEGTGGGRVEKIGENGGREKRTILHAPKREGQRPNPCPPLIYKCPSKFNILQFTCIYNGT